MRDEHLDVHNLIVLSTKQAHDNAHITEGPAEAVIRRLILIHVCSLFCESEECLSNVHQISR